MKSIIPIVIAGFVVLALASCDKQKAIENTLDGSYDFFRITDKEWKNDTLRRAILDTAGGTLSFSSGTGTYIWGSDPEKTFMYEVDGNILDWTEGSDTIDRILVGYKKQEFVNIMKRHEFTDINGHRWRFETFWEARR